MSTNAIIHAIIRTIQACQGIAHETAGTISGFFNDPVVAHKCATVIEGEFAVNVEVCGSQLTITL